MTASAPTAPTFRPSDALAWRPGANAAFAAVVAAILAWLGPPGGDLAAHVFQRNLFLEHGFSLWTNYWYAGRYSFVGYSLIYYPLAAFFGIKLLAVLSVAGATAAFTVVAERTWGSAAIWAARFFAVAAATSVISAAYPYCLGLAFALTALIALQHRRSWLFALLVGLTFAASPLAFVLLLVILAGVAVSRSRREILKPALAIAIVGLVAVVLWRLFPRRPLSVLAGRVPGRARLLWSRPRADLERGAREDPALDFRRLRGCLPRGLCRPVGARREHRAPPVRRSAARRADALAPALAAASLCDRDVRAGPLLERDPTRLQLRPHRERPVGERRVLAAGDRLPAPEPDARLSRRGGRHRGPLGSGLPGAGSDPDRARLVPAGRLPQNELLYDSLGRRAYLTWLHQLGVRYVVLTGAPVDYSSRSEAKLLRSGRSGLPVVFRTAEVTVFAVPSPVPIVTGPAHPRVLAFDDSSIEIALRRPGAYRVALHYTPYMAATNACLQERKDGMIELRAQQAGVLKLAFSLTASHALAAIAGSRSSCPEG